MVDSWFKNNVKNSFLEAKKHIVSLEAQIKAQNSEINSLKEQIKQLLTAIQPLTRTEEKKEHQTETQDLKVKSLRNDVSTGKKGVYSFIHSLDIHSLFNYALNQDLKKLFSTLTKQEFLTFLTVYQLQDDLKRALTYDDLATKLHLTSGCVRTYVSSLIKKGLPLVKNKLNNRIILISIDPKFKKLNIKQDLMNLYLDLDPHQTKLTNQNN